MSENSNDSCVALFTVMIREVSTQDLEEACIRGQPGNTEEHTSYIIIPTAQTSLEKVFPSPSSNSGLIHRADPIPRRDVEVDTSVNRDNPKSHI